MGPVVRILAEYDGRFVSAVEGSDGHFVVRVTLTVKNTSWVAIFSKMISLLFCFLCSYLWFPNFESFESRRREIHDSRTELGTSPRRNG